MLAICFGTIHNSITYRAPTELIQLDLAHINHPDVFVAMNNGDPMMHQLALDNVVENYESQIRILQPSMRSVKTGWYFLIFY